MPASLLPPLPALHPAVPANPLQPPQGVVGIGASAGGLEALSVLLASVPAGSGLAFVVVQHLDPSRVSLLPALLQHVCHLRVLEAVDGSALAAERVYVVPPNADLQLAGGKLRVVKRPPDTHAQHPIDGFFHSLAADCGRRAIGIVLSGMGSDGTVGLRAIQAAGGITLAQDPASAGFDSMPRAAILAGVVDEVLAPDVMGPSLQQLQAGLAGGAGRGHGRRKALHELMQLLQARTGHDFTGYKLNTVLRRIERRMKLHQLVELDDYVAFLRETPGEVQLLFRELLIGVTSFFRDGAVWQYLREVTLPAMMARHPQGIALKAWVPACSTGEEAYTLAMVFSEALEAAGRPAACTLQIFATDLDPDAIERARLGVFPRSIADSISPARLARHFEPCGKGYRVRKVLRNMIIFAQQNLISDPPFTKLDLLSCRNLLIYFTPKLQEQLIPLFHYALKRDGVLVLGSADSPGSFTDLFTPDGNGRVYRRLDGPPRRIASYFPTRVAAAACPQVAETKNQHMSSSLQTRVEHLLLNRHTPAAVLVNAAGDILYVHGRTGGFLEAAAGKANWNVHAMVREELRYEMAELIHRALASGQLETARGLLLRDAERVRQVSMTAEALSDESEQSEVLVTFSSEAVPSARRRKAKDPQVQELEQQLALARQELQSVRDEMQTSREELKSANEELQSTNEELQSTNEELTTSKEEMQSLNEELYTVNAELQSKVDDLSLVNGDMKNLLDNTGIAVIFLDNELKIRRFTTQATQIYRLIAADVGRALTDIVGDLQYTELDQDARKVLGSLIYCERQIPTSDGRWFVVRILPYRTVANVVDGLVVTFFNISGMKQLEARLERGGDMGAP